MKKIASLLFCLLTVLAVTAAEPEEWQDFRLDERVSLKVPTKPESFDLEKGIMYTSAVSEEVHLVMNVSPVSGVFTVSDTTDLKKHYSEFLKGMVTKVDKGKLLNWEMTFSDSLWMASFALERAGEENTYYKGHAVFLQDKMYSFTLMGPELEELKMWERKMLANLKFRNASYEEDQKSNILFINLSPAVKGRVIGVGLILAGILVAAFLYWKSAKKRTA